MAGEAAQDLDLIGAVVDGGDIAALCTCHEEAVDQMCIRDRDGDGNYLKINAKNGVVLAGGGFGGNKEMMDDLLPDIKRLFTKDEDFFAPLDVYKRQTQLLPLAPS